MSYCVNGTLLRARLTVCRVICSLRLIKCLYEVHGATIKMVLEKIMGVIKKYHQYLKTRDFKLPPRSRWELLSSRLLYSQ